MHYEKTVLIDTNVTAETEITDEDFICVPDEVTLQPNQYDVPDTVPDSYRKARTRFKLPVTVTKAQMRYFGKVGVPYTDIARFYNVNERTLKKIFGSEYERGYAEANTSIYEKMLEVAMNGNPTMLIWLSKNRLKFSDDGPTQDNITGEVIERKSDVELRELASRILKIGVVTNEKD